MSRVPRTLVPRTLVPILTTPTPVPLQVLEDRDGVTVRVRGPDRIVDHRDGLPGGGLRFSRPLVSACQPDQQGELLVRVVLDALWAGRQRVSC